MSLILDALNRAQEDRSSEKDVPSFSANHTPPVELPEPVWKKRWPYELLIVVLIGSYFVYSQLTSKPAAPMPVQAPFIEQASVQPESLSAVVKSVKPNTIATETALSDTVTPQSEPESANTTQVPESEKTVSVNPAVQSLYQAPVNNDAEPVAASPPVIKPKPVAEVPPELLELSRQKALAKRSTDSSQIQAQAQAAQESPIPSFYDLPWGFRQRVPTIDYAVHMYGETGASLVRINGENRRVGDQVAAGVVLQEISKDWVVPSVSGPELPPECPK